MPWLVSELVEKAPV